MGRLMTKLTAATSETQVAMIMRSSLSVEKIGSLIFPGDWQVFLPAQPSENHDKRKIPF